MRAERRGVSFQVAEGEHDRFWKRFSAAWEEETLDVFDRLVTPETTVLDIGAWIGPTTLYAAHTARRVIAFEPDPVAFRELSANVALNPQLDNIELHRACVAVEAGTVRLGIDSRPGDSESSIMFGDAESGWSVPAVRLDDLIARLGAERPLFIKMDVEGYEYELVPRILDVLTVPGTVLHLSTHPHVFGQQEARRARNRALAGVRRLLFGHYRSVVSTIRLAKALGSSAFVYSESGEPLDLRAGLLRALAGRAFTKSRAIIVSAEPLKRSNGAR